MAPAGESWWHCEQAIGAAAAAPGLWQELHSIHSVSKYCSCGTASAAAFVSW